MLERVNVYATMLWVIVLAAFVLKASRDQDRSVRVAQPTNVAAMEGGQS